MIYEQTISFFFQQSEFIRCVKCQFNAAKRYKVDLSNLPTNLETILLNEQTNYRLIEIGKFKDYFESEIKEQHLIIKKLSKSITIFDYCGKILTVF